MLYFACIQTKNNSRRITMKKTLLLSVVASTMIMAGGDIAPVEPAVEAPVAAVSAWNFNGQAVAYMQTVDVQGYGDLFDGDSTYGALGLQLGATNSNVFAGIGAGVELSAIEQDDGFSSPSAGGNAGTESSALTQAYLTYGFGDTSLKVGRQTLPKSLSPFAFSEGWQMFKNTYDAALVVNSSLPNTTLVYAFVERANRSVGDISDFSKIGVYSDAYTADHVHMLTAQNKSIENLTLTGSIYSATEMVAGEDVTLLWADATYKANGLTVGFQAGNIDGDTIDGTTAYGLKVATSLGGVGVSAAYTSVDDGTAAIENMGTNVKTPLYTQAILNQNTIKMDSDTLKLAASMKALNGKVTAYYINSDLGNEAQASTFNNDNGDPFKDGEGTYSETALMYKSKVTQNTTIFAGYVYQNDDRLADTQNFVRFWTRYNFN